jgi:hypothetical protein
VTTSTTIKRRARRIASDEAHAWARSIRLGNPFANSVLRALSLYVNGEGVCFVGIDALADDCDLSPDTVRKRIAWLDTVGAIVRLAQWIDADGKRNSEGRGKRTTDEIRLLLDADIAEIEAKATGNGDDISPRSQPGLNEEANSSQPSVSTGLALGQPSHCSEGLISEPEPEPEVNPQPPKGGGQVVDQEFEDQISEAIKAYPIPITNLPRFRTVWQAQDRATRSKILAAMRAFASFIADCERKHKPRAVKDADRWVAAGMWQGFVQLAENVDAAGQISHIEPDSEAGKAHAVLCRIAEIEPKIEGGKIVLKRSLSPRGLAFAGAPDASDWVFIADGADSNKIGAWRAFVSAELDMPIGRLVRERSWRKLKPEEVEAHGGRSTEIINQRGFLAPWPWPPRKDGTLSTTGPPDTLMTDQDVKDLDQLGKMTG